MTLGCVLCVSATSFGAITFSGNVLTYGGPSDLTDTIIDPPGFYTVAQSIGVSKAAFQALNPLIVGFNPVGGAPATPASGGNLTQLVVKHSATGTVTFTFAATGANGKYNYGSKTSVGRGAFSGASYQDAISTVPNQATDGKYDFFDATISTTGGRGVQTLGFCAAFRSDQDVRNDDNSPGKALLTLSDGSTETIDFPERLGGPGNPEYVFFGYQAPVGLTIVRVQYGRTDTAGGGNMAIDDLSFVLTAASTPGDINGDGHVDVADLLTLARSWGLSSGHPGYDALCDLNGDNSVDVVDLLVLADNFGT